MRHLGTVCRFNEVQVNFTLDFHDHQEYALDESLFGLSIVYTLSCYGYA
jgi:hypothetical protein